MGPLLHYSLHHLLHHQFKEANFDEKRTLLDSIFKE